MIFDDSEHVVGGHADNGPMFFDGRNGRLIDGNCPQGEGTLIQDGPTDGGDFAASAQIHNRIGPGIDAYLQLLEFRFDIAKIGRGADIGVDLGAKSLADAAGIKPMMIDIGRDDDRTIGHALDQQFGIHPLLLSHDLHLRRENSTSCQFQLRHFHSLLTHHNQLVCHKDTKAQSSVIGDQVFRYQLPFTIH
ncbi:MAG: hypothetical protein DDT26_00589 [Dehalococcoidia bacterium]|nr:hypothetical protein [Chloroflexota bacterium]